MQSITSLGSRCSVCSSSCGGYIALLDQSGVTICSGGYGESITNEELIKGDRSNRSGSFPSYEGSGGFSHLDRIDFEDVRMISDISNPTEMTYSSAVWASAASHKINNFRSAETIKTRIIATSWCPPPNPTRIVNSNPVFYASSYPFDDSVEAPLLALLFIDGSIRIYFKSFIGALPSASTAAGALLKPKWQSLWRDSATKELLASFRATAINCTDEPENVLSSSSSGSPGKGLLLVGHIQGLSILSIDYNLMFDSSSGSVIIAAQKCPPNLFTIKYEALVRVQNLESKATIGTASTICTFGEWKQLNTLHSNVRRKGLAVGLSSGQVIIADLLFTVLENSSLEASLEDGVRSQASVEIHPRFCVSLPGTSAISILRWHRGDIPLMKKEEEDLCQIGWLAACHGSKITLLSLKQNKELENGDKSVQGGAALSLKGMHSSSSSSSSSRVFRWALAKSPLISISEDINYEKRIISEAITIQNAHDLPVTGIEFSYRIPLLCGYGHKRQLQLYSSSLDGSVRSWNCENPLLSPREKRLTSTDQQSNLMTLVFAGRLPGLRAAITSQTAQPLLGLVLGGVGLLPCVLRFGEERSFHLSESMHLSYHRPKPSGHLEVISLLPQPSNDELSKETITTEFSSGFQAIELLSHTLDGLSNRLDGYNCDLRDFIRSIVAISITSCSLKRMHIRNSVASKIWSSVEGGGDGDGADVSTKRMVLNLPERIEGFDERFLNKLFDVKTLFESVPFDIKELNRQIASAPLYLSYFALLPILVRKACISFMRRSTPDLALDAVVEALRRILCASQTEFEIGPESLVGPKETLGHRKRRRTLDSTSAHINEDSINTENTTAVDIIAQVDKNEEPAIGLELTYLGTSFTALRPSDVPELWAKFALDAGPILAAAMYSRRALSILKMSEHITSIAGMKTALVDRRDILSTYGAIAFWTAAAAESTIIDKDQEVIEEESIELMNKPFLPNFLRQELTTAIDIVNKKVSRTVHAALEATQSCIYCGSSAKFRFETRVVIKSVKSALHSMSTPFAPASVTCINGHRLVVNALTALRLHSFVLND
jgi:hypothetical protein